MGQSINPIMFEMYEKLVDDVYFLGSNAILRFNVVLAKKSEDGKRYFYHSEYMYNSNKYLECDKLVTMKRSFEYYLSIENIKQVDGQKESIMIRIQDMILIQGKLKLACKWFTSEEFGELFAYSKNKIVKLGKADPIQIIGLAGQKMIRLEPIVIDYEDISYEGIRLYLNSDSNYVDMTVDRFMGLLYIINTINLYESAQLLINYQGRPELGFNIYSFEGDAPHDDNGYVKSMSKRKVPTSNTAQKSFFDKVKEIE